MQSRPRRDWLITTAFAAAGIGAAFALWPFVAALGPDAETSARRKLFDLRDLKGTAPSVVPVAAAPIFVFRRTADELAALRDGRGQEADGRLRDPHSDRSQQPAWAKNWHRSLHPEIMVCIGACTREDCVVGRAAHAPHHFLCPCCGSKYDLAGRALSGPAAANLTVPPHRFISATVIEFVEAAPAG